MQILGMGTGVSPHMLQQKRGNGQDQQFASLVSAFSEVAINTAGAASAPKQIKSPSVSLLASTPDSRQSCSAPILDDAFFRRAYTADEATRGRMWADAAKAVSSSQGMSEGKFDFSRMTPAQSLVVINDQIMNHGGDPLNETISINQPALTSAGHNDPAWQTPANYIMTALNALSFAKSNGDTDTAASYQKSLDFMTRLSAPTTYDHFLSIADRNR